MADAAPDTSPVGTSLDAMVLSAPPKEVTEGLATLEREKIGKSEKAYSEAEHGLERDRARVEHAYNETGISPNELKPWNEQEQSRKFQTDPIEAFASLGSVFGIVASAFTHAPMENALNASAAAINAVKAGNDKEYERTHTAWKENMDLAIKRHNIQHEAYQDAISLMKTNLAAGEAKIQMLAARFGDKKTLFLLENGMSKELIELQEARNKQALGAMEAMDKITLVGLKRRMLESDPNWQAEGEQDPYKKAAHRLEAFNRIYGVKQTAQQEILGRFLFEHPQATAEEIAKFADEHGIIPRYGSGRGGGVTTLGRIDAQQVMERAKKYAEDPDSPTHGDSDASYARAREEVKALAAPPITGNRKQQIESHINQYDSAIALTDKIEKTLDKYVGSAGLAGKATRLGERLSNIAGSHATDRVQMMRDISELQLMAPRLLLDQSTSRPLSVEASHISDIIAGLSAGDTTANTLRSMKEIRKQFEQLRKHNQQTIGGKPKEEAPVESGAKPRWMDAPVVGQ